MKLCMKRLRNAVGKAIGVVAALLCFGTATALADSINLSEVTENKTVADGTTLTGTLGANVKISIADGATVTLDGVVINGVNDEDCGWAGITCEGGVTGETAGVKATGATLKLDAPKDGAKRFYRVKVAPVAE